MLPDDEEIAGQRARQGEDGSGERVRGRGQQQHDGRNVRDQVREHDRRRRRARPAARGRRRAAAQRRERAREHARVGERAVHDEQPDEEHEQLPVDEAEDIARGHRRLDEQERPPRARATTSRGQRRERGTRATSAASTSQALGGLPAVEAAARRSRAPASRAPPLPRRASARSRPDDAEAEHRRHAGVEQVARERAGASAWPISMFCGLPISVAAEPTLAAQASASRNGTGSRPRRAHTSTSTGAIARQTMSLASSAESPPAAATRSASSASGEAARAASRRVSRS